MVEVQPVWAGWETFVVCRVCEVHWLPVADRPLRLFLEEAWRRKGREVERPVCDAVVLADVSLHRGPIGSQQWFLYLSGKRGFLWSDP